MNGKMAARDGARSGALGTIGPIGATVLAALVALASALLAVRSSAQGTPASPAAGLYRYADADLALGEQLMREHRCEACHIRNVGGNGTAIYRPRGRINTPGALRGMVEYCSVELKLSLFPEEVTSIAAVLQRDHYRFPAAAAARP